MRLSVVPEDAQGDERGTLPGVILTDGGEELGCLLRIVAFDEGTGEGCAHVG